MNRERVRQYLQAFEFKTLFIEEMGWSNAPTTKPSKLILPHSTIEYQQHAIAKLSGVVVYEITPLHGDFPDAKTRKAIHKEISKTAYENLLIFVDHADPAKRSRSLWYWVKREDRKEQPREHLYVRGQPGDLFLSKLDSMVIELDDLRPDGTVPITEATSRLAASLDIERVTKKFYTEFSSLRVQFTELITGIGSEADRGWYASVLLNRLMFIYFLQKKGFIDHANTTYLTDKLAESQQRGDNRFYSEFLQMLFFEGFAKPADQRSPEAQHLLGNIKYLNGGLFIKHQLEEKYPAIAIPDQAFQNLFTLFGRYSWHLDDTPGANDNEISPDVLGYIFEKYINQKAFGAYYTRTEITTYLCERTIHAVLVEKINMATGRTFESIEELLLKLDADLCRRLLHDVLPKLSVLDPACGSGAFLVAAMKTLLNIYAAVFGKIEFLTDRNLSAELQQIRADHASVNYYIRKRIITDNLYGVDIMQEAAEIAKLRLFLSLVAAAQSVDQLEPLPNIDFNIMTGNSLIGLLKVDEVRFNAGQGLLFQSDKAAQYRHLLNEKNRLIDLYRHASSLTENLQSIRDQIEAHKTHAYAVLNAILLDDFQSLKIKYEQALPTGKSEKRPLTLADMEALQPFHWGYEFDEIMETRGGFDVIITNPPWEILKPQAKEFFAEYSQLVSKNKMTIKDFEKEQEQLLQDPEVNKAWLDYQSRFPHISAYFRATPHFANQIALVNGKKAGTDINLYKLFIEHCFNLARKGGQTGIVVPSGIYTDLGAKQLRQMLFGQTQITGLFGFENRKEIFEGVDSRFKFVVLTYHKGGTTQTFPAAFMRHEVRELEAFPTVGGLPIAVDLVQKLAPDSLSVMEFKTALDVQIAEKMLRFPLLGEEVEGKWQLKLTREFDMTNDSHLFKTEPAPGRLPLYEGKMIHQFTHQWEGAKTRYWVDEAEGRKAILGARGKDSGQKLDYQGYRLGFRDIARNTDSRTLISTIIPPTFHGNKIPTVCIFDDFNQRYISDREQFFLCAVWNSFIIDYSLRQRITTTINFFYLYQLPVPRLSAGERFFEAIVERAARLVCTTPEFDDLAKEVGLGSHQAGATDAVERAKLRAELDGMVAHLYGLSEAEFSHILGTFPLVGEAVKLAALNAYRDVERGLMG